MLVMEAFGRVLVAGAVSRHRGAGRHSDPTRRHRRATEAHPAGDRRRPHEAGIRARRAAGALRPDRCDDDRDSTAARAGCWTAPRPWSRTAMRRQADRQRAHRGRARRRIMASRCSWSNANANGVARRGYAMRDEQRAADVSLSNVRVSQDDVLGEVGDGLRDHRARDRGRHRGDRGRNRSARWKR